jgi:hypothetical protein
MVGSQPGRLRKMDLALLDNLRLAASGRVRAARLGKVETVEVRRVDFLEAHSPQMVYSLSNLIDVYARCEGVGGQYEIR